MTRQVQDSLVAVPHAELTRRAQHPGRVDATELRPADLHAARQFGADPGQRCRHPGARIGRSADDLDRLGTSVIHDADRQLVRIGMRTALEDAGDDHAGERAGGAIDRLDLESGHRQSLRERVRVPTRPDPLTQPCSAYAHAFTPG